MKKVNVIGMKCVHKYAKLDAEGVATNELLEVECTEAELNEVRYNNQQPPSVDGYEWVCSVERHKVDTPSGDLEDGQYYEHTTRVVKLVGNNPCGFDVAKNPNAGIDLPSIEAMASDPSIKEEWPVVERATIETRDEVMAQKAEEFSIKTVEGEIM